MRVSGSMSAITGVSPARSTASAVAVKVMVGTITSAPGGRLSSSRARCRAAVQDETAIAETPPPTAWAKAPSNSSATLPVVSQPDLRTVRTPSMSGPVMWGRWKGIISGGRGIAALLHEEVGDLDMGEAGRGQAGHVAVVAGERPPRPLLEVGLLVWRDGAEGVVRAGAHIRPHSSVYASAASVPLRAPSHFA